MFRFIVIVIILGTPANGAECGSFPNLKFRAGRFVEGGEKLDIEVIGEQFIQIVFSAQQTLGKFELVNNTLLSLDISLRIVKAQWLAPRNYTGTETLSAQMDFGGHYPTCTIKRNVIVTNYLRPRCYSGDIENLHITVGRTVEYGQKLDIEISSDKFDHVTLRAEHWFGSFNFVEPNIPALTELKRGRALLTSPFEGLKYTKAQWLPPANYKGTMALVVTVSRNDGQFSSCTLNSDVMVTNAQLPDCVGAGIQNFNIAVPDSVVSGQNLDIEIAGDNFSGLILRAYDEQSGLGSFHFVEPVVPKVLDSRQGFSSVTVPTHHFKNIKGQWLAPLSYKGYVTLFAQVSLYAKGIAICTLARNVLVKESVEPVQPLNVIPLP